MRQNMPILMEDDQIIVIVKPAGMPSQGDRSGAMDVVNGLRNQLAVRDKKVPQIYPVHRLDRPVGGVMVYAKTSKAAAALSKQVQNHSICKKYYAAAEGEFTETLAGEPIRAVNYLKKNARENRAELVDADDPEGKKAELFYRGLRVKDGLTLLEVELLTGRHHQIRAQMAARQMGLAGDTKYNPGTAYRQLGLFSCELVFEHPVTGNKLVFRQQPTGPVFSKFFE